MQLQQALTLLEIATEASTNERKQAFESKRDKLEGQIAQSPTPALKEKFRAKLKELEQAYALIEKELASDELPVAAPVNVSNNQTQGSFQQNPGQHGNNQQNSDFAAEHHWKLQIMEELDERFGKTLNSSQLQGYLASCAPQQNLDTLIPLALDKIKKYGKEPLDSEYYKQAKWLQNTLFTLFVANRKDHPAFRELLHQETITGIEAIALLCAEKKHFVTPTQQEALQLRRQKIKRVFPKFVALSVLVISVVIAQPYVSEYIDDRNNVLEIVDGALDNIQRKNFYEAQKELNRASNRGVAFTNSKIKEVQQLLSESKKKQSLIKVKRLILFAKQSISALKYSDANDYLNQARGIGLLKEEIIQTSKLLRTNSITANGRYKLLNQGQVIEDTKTGLQWMRCSLGQTFSDETCTGKPTEFEWHKAINEAKNVTYINYSDWRLPTKEELFTLVFCSSGQPKHWEARCRGSYLKPTVYKHTFPNTSVDIYWTSLSSKSDDFAWGVSFQFSTSGAYQKGSSQPVRLVRTKK